jgi:hypothetical protein
MTVVEMALVDGNSTGGGGDECLANIRGMLAWLDDNGHERSAQQVQLQEAFVKASLRFIYQGEFDKSIERVMRENDWPQIWQEVLIGTPRRFGKTYSTSEYACVFMLAVRGARVCIYSTGKDTAVAVLDHIRMFFRALPCHNDFDIVVDNEKTLRISPKTNPNDTRIVKSYTSNAKIRHPFLYRCRRIHIQTVCIISPRINASVSSRVPKSTRGMHPLPPPHVVNTRQFTHCV